ncbi:ribonuclease H-like domain-containing protein [Shouchella patagoniensis]|uniref:ribonuclease H-like domain-containing protein n=1 Tax=Shouchella patagoniensis TaxID=228576 RepID=UPI00147389FF|nr:ribonuclease H-like domain-containing protein [Shouchella patagoniensis]
MSIKSKIKRFESHLSSHPKQEQELEADQQQLKDHEDTWAQIETHAHVFDSMICFIREKEYSYGVQHGDQSFAEMKEILNRWDTSNLKHPLSKKGLPLSKLIFFDTETTGLSSGAGTQMFLLGYASFTDTGVRVRQYLLSGPEAEPALYHFFLADVKGMDHLVSFNGKAFDWPRLKTRHAYLRDAVPALPKFGHFDLLHGSRRLWKDTLPSCNLSTLESEKLAIKRHDDTPSYLVPMLYFDFVREGDPSFIKSVLTHHEIDVLSLIALYAKLTETILGASDYSTDKEQYEIARWYESTGESEQALALFNEVELKQSEWRYPARFKKAYLLKKKRAYTEAISSFLDCLQNDYHAWESATEIALITEHHFKDPNKAMDYAQRALRESTTSKERMESIKRIKRLKQKSNK